MKPKKDENPNQRCPQCGRTHLEHIVGGFDSWAICQRRWAQNMALARGFKPHPRDAIAANDEIARLIASNALPPGIDTSPQTKSTPVPQNPESPQSPDKK